MENCFYLQNKETMPACCGAFFKNRLMEFQERAEAESKKSAISEMEKEIKNVLLNIRRNYTSFYKELRQNGFNTVQIEYVFNIIVSFTVNHKDQYLGVKSECIFQLVDRFYSEETEVFFVFKYYGIQNTRIKEIIRTIMGVTLEDTVYKKNI